MATYWSFISASQKNIQLRLLGSFGNLLLLVKLEVLLLVVGWLLWLLLEVAVVVVVEMVEGERREHAEGGGDLRPRCGEREQRDDEELKEGGKQDRRGGDVWGRGWRREEGTGARAGSSEVQVPRPSVSWKDVRCHLVTCQKWDDAILRAAFSPCCCLPGGLCHQPGAQQRDNHLRMISRSSLRMFLITTKVPPATWSPSVGLASGLLCQSLIRSTSGSPTLWEKRAKDRSNVTRRVGLATPLCPVEFWNRT